MANMREIRSRIKSVNDINEDNQRNVSYIFIKDEAR